MIRKILLVVALISLSLFADSKKEKKWNKLENCKYLENKANDGDSFHVDCDKEYLFRLYFIDTPESEESLLERIDEQADYFGISREESLKLGKAAAEFTRKSLSDKSLTIWTKWSDARGRSRMQRFYALIYIEGKDHNESLVEKGYARIYGYRTKLPNGQDSKQYLKTLKGIEAKAKKIKQGGWGY